MVAADGTLTTALMKTKRPFVSALIVLGWTVAAIVVVSIVAGIATATIFGGSDEAFWGLTIGFMLFTPIALLTGFTLAIKRFTRNRRAQRNQNAS
jgi:membrane protein implicated in regulation of membrane protease activity